MLRLKKGPNQPVPILYIIYLFRTIFYLINYSLQDTNYIRPRNFLFLRPHFATPTRDLTFATHIREPHSRPHIRDSHFTTPIATPFRDSRLRLH